MKLVETGFNDLRIIQPFVFKDERGGFVKTIHDEFFAENGLDYNFRESFYSISNKGVIRGMHFQNPPYQHNKLVYVLHGSIMDVVLDLRKSSPTYGKTFSRVLSAENREIIYIGAGFAHGFLSLEPNSIVEYHTSTSLAKAYEGGILWNSFDFDWAVENPVISDRDRSFLSFKNFDSPFT
jgi:dTDP-4-dehydrorhamnose 3,5-epimerase